MNSEWISPIVEKKISAWVRAQEKLLVEEARQYEKQPAQMICVEENPLKR